MYVCQRRMFFYQRLAPSNSPTSASLDNWLTRSRKAKRRSLGRRSGWRLKSLHRSRMAAKSDIVYLSLSVSLCLCVCLSVCVKTNCNCWSDQRNAWPVQARPTHSAIQIVIERKLSLSEFMWMRQTWQHHVIYLASMQTKINAKRNQWNICTPNSVLRFQNKFKLHMKSLPILSVIFNSCFNFTVLTC